jgi:hypothetical protein
LTISASFYARSPLISGGDHRLDELGRSAPAVVLASPAGELSGALGDRLVAERTLGREPHDARADEVGGIRTPAPTQSTRAAFSLMSPTAGHASTAAPLDSARTSVP